MGEPSQLHAVAARAEAKSRLLATLLDAPGVDAAALLREILAELESDAPEAEVEVEVEEEADGPDYATMRSIVRKTLFASDHALSLDAILDQNDVLDLHERTRWKSLVGGYGKLGTDVRYDLDRNLHVDRHDPTHADGYDALSPLLARLADGPKSRAELVRSNGSTYRARALGESALATLRKRGLVVRVARGIYQLAPPAAPIAAPPSVVEEAIEAPEEPAPAPPERPTGRASSKRARVCALLLAEGPLDSRAICDRFTSDPVERNRWTTTLWVMRRDGYVRRDAEGRYTLLRREPAAPERPSAPVTDAPTRERASRGAKSPADSGETPAELLQRVVAGDAKAWRPFWASIERFVQMQLARDRVQAHEMADAKQDVQMQIHRAASGYDPSRGGVLTWVGWQVRAVRHKVDEARETIHVPPLLRPEVRKLRRGTLDLETLTDRHQTNLRAANAACRMLSTETPLGDESSGTLLDTLPANDGSVEDTLVQSLDGGRASEATAAVLQAFRRTLSQRERAVYDGRIAVDPEDAVTLVELGSTFRVSRERIRQIEGRLREALKAYLLERLGTPDQALAGYR